MSIVHLTVEQASYHFEAHELPELRKILAEIDKHTLVIPAGGPKDLYLNEEGRLINGYGYTVGALTQLCSLVAPGLAQLVMDLSGQWRRTGQDSRIFSGGLAIKTLNDAINLRFDRRLVGLQIVRNTKTKTIDGVVGAKYRYLSNSDFLSRVDQECANHAATFLEACLYGRHFVVRYADRQGVNPCDIVNEIYTFGYHFANSEIGGKSVRAAPFLLRQASNACVLWPFTAGAGGRVVHSGKDFEKKLHALMGHIVQKQTHRSTLGVMGNVLENISLKLGDTDHEKRVRNIVQALTRRRLTQNFARRVVSAAASKGRDKEDALIDVLPAGRRAVLSGRTAYDLFVALINEARNLPIDQRETAEQVAHLLLTGKIGI